MLGRSGVIDLEESCHQLNRQTLVGTDLGNHTSLSKWALAVEPCLACLLPFLGFWAPVAWPHPISNTGMLPQGAQHRCRSSAKQVLLLGLLTP